MIQIQAKLPDVNSAITYYRSTAITNLERKNYPICVTAIRCMNALLPSEYRVRISTEQYEQAELPTIILICTKCKTEIELSKANRFKQPSSFSPELTWFWKCSMCKEVMELEAADKIKKIKKNPTFHKIAPDPPPIIPQFGEKGKQIVEFLAWFNVIMPELENQVSLYRTEYQRLEGDTEE